MGLVNLVVNKRRYEIACGDGEEQHLKEMAALVGEKVDGLVSSLGNVPESKLLFMVCLLIADELNEARQAGTAAPAIDPALVERINQLAERIEAIAERLDQS